MRPISHFFWRDLRYPRVDHRDNWLYATGGYTAVLLICLSIALSTTSSMKTDGRPGRRFDTLMANFLNLRFSFIRLRCTTTVVAQRRQDSTQIHPSRSRCWKLRYLLYYTVSVTLHATTQVCARLYELGQPRNTFRG